MIRLLLVLALFIVPQACFGQGTFNGAAAGQTGSGVVKFPITVTKQRIDAANEGAIVRFETSIYEVVQVVDDKNARLSIRSTQGKGGAIMGPAVEVWYEGPTSGLADGQKIFELPEVRLTGTKTYESLAGPRTLIKVKHYSEAETEKLVAKWKADNPDHVELTMKSGESSPVKIIEYKAGSVLVEYLGETSTIKNSKLDKASKDVIKKWRKSQKDAKKKTK